MSKPTERKPSADVEVGDIVVRGGGRYEVTRTLTQDGLAIIIATNLDDPRPGMGLQLRKRKTTMIEVES